jgi:hypothetical protein
MHRLFLCAALLLSACPKETPVTEPTPEKKSNQVVLVGTKSIMIMQSPVSPSFSPGKPEPEMWYLDISGDNARQVTLYSEKVPDCDGQIEVTATPREVTASKGGGDITFTQYDVISWKCL